MRAQYSTDASNYRVPPQVVVFPRTTDDVLAALEVAREVMSRIDKDVKMEPAVRFHTFGESSIDFNVILHSSNFDHQFLLKHEFIKALTRRYREEGIDIPYPIRSIQQMPQV